MKSCEAIRSQLLNRMNRLRRTQRIVNTNEFETAWEVVTLEESQLVEAMISLNQAEKIQAWLDSKCRKTYDEMTLKELRELAKVHAIHYYGSMNKATLIWEIYNAIDRTNSVRNAPVVSVGQHPR
jgi:hypothetical protein